MKKLAAGMISVAFVASIVPAIAQSSAPRAPTDSGPALTARLERLEEQLVDLQGVVAAVETLAKTNATGATGYQAATNGGVSAEQLRQLSEQLAELTQRLERLEARLGSAAPTGQPRAAPASGFEDKEQLPPLNSAQASANPNAGRQSANAAEPPVMAATPPRPASQSASTSSPARTLFEQGTGALNRREYSAAETYFQQFLDQYPSDTLAGSAQYWLGETAFVSGEYRAAADRFLKTFTNYPSSERAPEALLKLAISLRRLGENAAACDSFAELQRRFPQAPKTLLQKADTEKKRANCA
jgi:tol-pal system protein YbgF